MQTVVETELYLRDAKATGLSDDERKGIVDFIASHPDAGHEIPGTEGARKLRSAALADAHRRRKRPWPGRNRPQDNA